MAAVGCAYPPPPMVGTYRSYPPPRPKRAPPSVAQPLLFALVTLALCGMVVQACFIYYLYDNQASEEKENSPQGHQGQIQPTTSSSPSKPVAHLIAGPNKPGKDGVMVWEVAEKNDPVYQIIMHKMKYSNGKIIIQEEGYYSVYSKIYFREPSKYMILHEVAKTTPRYPHEIALLRSKRFLRKAEKSETTYSYLGGVFHLLKNEAIFVKVNNHTDVILSGPADNYFGAYMV